MGEGGEEVKAEVGDIEGETVEWDREGEVGQGGEEGEAEVHEGQDEDELEENSAQ